MTLWEYIKAEIAVLKGAPVTFIGLAIISVGAGIALSQWHFGERLQAKDDQIHRYRVALGIDEASKGALVELNNQELALKAQSTVAKLRNLAAEFNSKRAAIPEPSVKSKKERDAQIFKADLAVMKEVAQEFDRTLASDVDNLRNELRKRLDPSAIAHVVQVPAYKATDGASIPVTELFRGMGPDAFYLSRLADEIEQMANLLPSH